MSNFICNHNFLFSKFQFTTLIEFSLYHACISHEQWIGNNEESKEEEREQGVGDLPKDNNQENVDVGKHM